MSKLKLGLFSMVLGLSALANAETVRIDAYDDPNFADPGFVDSVQMIEGHPMVVKLMVLGQGDPARNGMHLHLSVNQMESGAGRWNTYPLKDVRNYKILPSAKPGYLKLELSNDAMNDEGHIYQYRSVLFVNMNQAAKPRGYIEVEEVTNHR